MVCTLKGLTVKNLCFLFEVTGSNLEGDRVCTPPLDFSSKIVVHRSSLFHKQGDLVHQFGVLLGCEFKVRLLL